MNGSDKVVWPPWLKPPNKRDIVIDVDDSGANRPTFSSLVPAGRQYSDPTEVLRVDPSSVGAMQYSSDPRPHRGRSFSENLDMDPRIAQLCQRIAEGNARIPLPMFPSPVVFALPPPQFQHVQTPPHLSSPFLFSPSEQLDEGSRETSLADIKEDGCVEVTCALDEADAIPVLIVGCLMSLAQGTSLSAFLGTIGYFSHRYEVPELAFYVSVVQAIAGPVVLDVQRRYDHLFDVHFGHNFTYLLRIVGMSLVQAILLSLVPFVQTWPTYLLLSCLAATCFIGSYAKVCMVVSCVDGPQAVNFARTASHCGGLVVVFLSTFFHISSQSSLEEVMGFFFIAAILQVIALIAWCIDHFKNSSLKAAYALIAQQQARTAEVVAAASKACIQGDKHSCSGGYTLTSMFGSHWSGGLMLLVSFTAVQVAFSFSQSVLNIFGDQDLTQRLVLLMYAADVAGRIASHVLNGLGATYAEKVPLWLLHSLTMAVVGNALLLLADARLLFLQPHEVGVVVLVLCAVTAFNMNELAVQTMRLALSKAQVSHCQNYMMFAATGVAKLGALAVQFWTGTI